MEKSLDKTQNIDWYDVRNDIEDERITFLIVIGGRGIGKTYSGLDWLQEFSNMLYLRNQLEEIQFCCTEKGNPFKKLNADKGYSYTFEKTKGLYNILELRNIEGENEPKKIDRGLALPLATVGKVKGFDFSDYGAFAYDEFIPDPTVMMRFNAGQAFLSFYETAARNREILGEPPLKGIFLSNATTIQSDVLAALGVQDTVEFMVRQGLKKLTLPERRIKIVLPECKLLQQLKAETSCYKAAGKDSEFARFALKNEFTKMSLQNVKKRPLMEYNPVCAYDDLFIYKHKHRNEYYVTTSFANVERYTSLDTSELFKRRFWIYKDLMLDGTFIYSSYMVKMQFLSIFNLTNTR